MTSDSAFELIGSLLMVSTQLRTYAIPAPPFMKNPCVAQGRNCATASKCVVLMLPWAVLIGTQNTSPPTSIR
jgi:hypothetical protein